MPTVDTIVLLEAVLALMISIPQLLFYTTYALLSWRALKYKPPTPQGGRMARDISFIIPVRREPVEYLDEAVRYVHSLGIPGYEIIVVSDDDESVKQELYRRLDEWRRSGLNVWLVWRSMPVGFRTGALNTGLNLSNKDYIYVMDVDSRPEKCFFDNGVALLEGSEDTIAVVGRWEPLNTNSRLGEALGYSMKFIVNAIYRGRSSLGLSVFPLGTGTLYKTRVLKNVLGGWDQERLQDDMEIGSRIIYHGFNIVYLDSCAIYVENPSTYKALRIQQSRWAYGAADTLVSRFKHIVASRQRLLGKIEALFFLSQYIVPSLVFLGTLVLAVYTLVNPVDILARYLYLITALLLAEGLFGWFYYKSIREYNSSAWRTLVNMGRASAVTTALSPYYFYNTIKAILRIKVKYARTPKGAYQWEYKRLRIPWEIIIAVFFAASSVWCLMHGVVVTGLWILVNTLGYAYVAYRWPRDVILS
ncbi:MAG: glycosyltransferase family 2 protein [Desulfurococcus sp.]|nr:glycosyltransferase family 2 protein [Desulfurococcus sp.]